MYSLHLAGLKFRSKARKDYPVRGVRKNDGGSLQGRQLYFLNKGAAIIYRLSGWRNLLCQDNIYLTPLTLYCIKSKEQF